MKGIELVSAISSSILILFNCLFSNGRVKTIFIGGPDLFGVMDNLASGEVKDK
jgi:hypothetical protein